MEIVMRDSLLTEGSIFFNIQIDPNWIQFQPTKKEVSGDLTLVVFPFAKAMQCSPVVAANRIGEFLSSKFSEIDSFEVIQGFLNFKFSTSHWRSVLETVATQPNFGFGDVNSKPLIMVEYSSPNTNKPLHLGHLRNNFLGYSVSELLKANGHQVIKTQVINDRGIHICKSMLAWKMFSPLNDHGDRESPLNTGLKGDKLVGKYYVEFDKHLNQEAKAIISEWEASDFEGYPSGVVAKYMGFAEAKLGKDEKTVIALDAKIKELAKNSTAILRDAKEMLIKWEARDPEVYLLWTTMNGWVYEGFKQTYKRMGVDFDTLYYESDTFLLGKDQVMEGIQKGVFYQKEDGSVWIDLTKEGLDEKLVLRSDGTAVYMTQDIGTAIDRYKDFPLLNGMIYTVGNEQDYHFKVLFLILEKLGFHWAKNCHHLSYGMVDLPTGKMKSREGTVVDADDLMEEMVAAAEEMTKERGHISEMNPQEQKQLFEQIGMGGLKYFLLKVDPKKRMMFNPEESIDLTGNTGPFIQYTHARITSLLRKSDIPVENLKVNKVSESEIPLIKIIEQFPSTLQDAATTYSPAVLANYLYELTKAFNSFYQQCAILNEPDEDLKMARIQIALTIQSIISRGLKILGITAPNKM